QFGYEEAQLVVAAGAWQRHRETQDRGVQAFALEAKAVAFARLALKRWVSKRTVEPRLGEVYAAKWQRQCRRIIGKAVDLEGGLEGSDGGLGPTVIGGAQERSAAQASGSAPLQRLK